MQIKQSKTLQKHLDRGLSEAGRSGNAMFVGEIAFISLISEGMSHASHILSKLLKEWEILRLQVQIERELTQNIIKDGASDISADAVYQAIIEGLCEVCAEHNNEAPSRGTHYFANSGHFLVWLLGNKELACSRALEIYGVTAEKVWEYLEEMPLNEDYYEDIMFLQELPAKSKLRHIEEQYDGEYEDTPEAGNGNTLAATRTRVRQSELTKHGEFLTDAAREGRIDPVIGREREIERLVQILGRRKKNNPVLIGEAGVGKSAVVEGLAMRIVQGNVPPQLADKRIFSLDMASLIAGTKFRGEFEERIKAIVDELKGDRSIILFIDEIHTIAGAGSSNGSLDTANILKPALARGEVQCIGATTLDEYRETIEKDGALERRFQKIIIEPTTKEQTLEILHRVKGQYERHHSVRYTDEALAACVELTDRYICDRNFPDKALDVIDEAGAKARVKNSDEPQMLKELRTAVSEAAAELKAAEETRDRKRMLVAMIKEHSLRERFNEYNADCLRIMAMKPVVIDVGRIEEIVSSMMGIPVENASRDEKKRLGGMEKHIARRVIGQSAAVGKVTKSILRSRTGLKDPGKPTGVFLFAGPTGVGKTHLAKELAQWMFDSKDAMIRVDMSEYSEKHNVSRMIGSPPGYVGYNEGGQLTEAVRRQPYSVILFDEIEKAHPDVFNIMLQIFDEGQLTDGSGRKVDFRNTVIIMTSNVGSRAAAQKPAPVGYNTAVRPQAEQAGKEVGYRAAIEKVFPPEFINRIDDIVLFNSLGIEDVTQIVDLELAKLRKRIKSLEYGFSITPKARLRLAELGYSRAYGVRALKRTILEHIEEPLAQMIVSGELKKGDTITVGRRGDAIEVAGKRTAALKEVS